MKKILITGVTGFIGRHLIDKLKLESGLELHGLCREKDNSKIKNNVHFFNSYDQILEIVAKIKPDIICHVAAKYSLDNDPDIISELIDSNIKLTTMLAEAARRGGVKKFIYVGTAWQQYVYDSLTKPLPVYTVSKALGYLAATSIIDCNKTKCIGVQLSETFGKGDRRSKIIDLMINALRDGNKLKLTPGDQEVLVASVEYVVDTLKGIISDEIDVDSGDYILPGRVISLKNLSKFISGFFIGTDAHDFGALPYRPDTIMKISYDKSRYLPTRKPFNLEIELEEYIRNYAE